MLVAADTFPRAAAARATAIWGDRTHGTVVTSVTGADPASLAYKSIQQAKTDGTQVFNLLTPLDVCTIKRPHGRT